MSETGTKEQNNHLGNKKAQKSNNKHKEESDSGSEMNEEVKDQKDGTTISGHNVKEETIDVVITFMPKYEKELVQNVRVLVRENGDIDFCELLRSLKNLCFPIEKNMISYYSFSSDMFVFCGGDPIPPNSYIPAREVALSGETKQISIKVRQVQPNIPLPEPQLLDNNAGNMKNEGSEGGNANAPKAKRTKERKIGEILDKVLQWRRLYTGVTDPQTGQTVKMSLEEAAQRVSISKKSLDDYLLQIRFGKKYGFNFNDHYNERVGVLRAFVKKYKNKMPSEKLDDDKNGHDFESLIDKKDHKGKEVRNESQINSRSKKIK